MFYKVQCSITYKMSTIVEASSPEEAMKWAKKSSDNNDDRYDWEEEDNGEHVITDMSCALGLDSDNDPAYDIYDIETWQECK